jgi:hypothetical protein
MGGFTFAAAFLALGTPEAHAARYYVAAGPTREVDQGLTLAVDGNLLLPVADSIGNGRASTNPFGVGFGVDGRLGFRVRGGPVFFQPEVDLGLAELSETIGTGRVSASTGAFMGRFTVGARAGLRGVVEPQLFAHLGYAGGDFHGFTYDVGGAVDLHVRRFTFGAHASWNEVFASESATVGAASVSASETVNFLNIGLHAGVIL